jgi:hypothetical protein
MLEKLTKKQEELMSEVRDNWIDLALHKTNFDKEEIEAGVKWIYYSANLKEPKVIFVDGPKDFAKKFSASVRASVRASVGDSVRASVGDSVRDSVSYMCLSGDSEDASYMEYWNKIGIYKDEDKKLEKYLGYLKLGVWYAFFFEKVAFIMRRPTVVKQNERKQLHSTDGPALAFKDGTKLYMLNGVQFDKKWFDKIVGDKMTPQQIFAIDNTEHRRIAYEFMDKTKMKNLKGLKVLDEVKDDGYGYKMKVISFEVKNIDEPLKYLNCFCPSTGREYFLGTNKDTCLEAKNALFGLSEVEYIKEW